MNELLGIPMASLVVVLVAALAVALGALGALAFRNRVFVKLGLRSAARRPARSSLVVLGLMLGTAIVAAALTTGDTMSHTIRSLALDTLGQTDEVVSAQAADVEGMPELGGSTGNVWFDEDVVARVEQVVGASELVDGVAPAIAEEIAVQNATRRQNEPRVMLFATDQAHLEGFGVIEQVGGGAVSLSALGQNEVYLDEEAAEELRAQPGDRLTLFAADRPEPARVKAIVRYAGTLGEGPSLLVSLEEGQRLLGQDGKIEHVLVSNRGDTESGAALSDEVIRLVEPAVAPLALEVDAAKADALEAADEAGSAFMSFFTTFGSFSIAAGILLIFLIFVMLAAERRGELGIARALGTRRGHLVQMYVFEGVSYDLVAAAVGTLLGAGVAYVMVLVMAQAFEETGFDVEYAVTARGLIVAYALGVLLTLVVVAVSAWRVSVLTISTAIRNLPEPLTRKGGRRRWILGLAGLLLGLLLFVAGLSGSSATPFLLGISFILMSLVPLTRALGAPERATFTAAGLLLVAAWLLPIRVWEALTGELSMDFSVWIAGGLMIVVGAIWTLIYNADVLLGALTSSFGRFSRLAPILKMSLAYPLASRFRTGVTVAMFTLVVFTLVTGATISGSFINAANDAESFGGGFDVRSSTSPVNPIDDMHAALTRAPGIDPANFEVVASQSVLAAEARQVGTQRPLEPYAVRGLDSSFTETTTYGLAATARGYASAADVWRALREQPGLAVVDGFVVPRRDNFGFNALPPDFKLTGFFLEDGAFEPIPVELRDPQTGRRTRLTVIGVLSDTVPLEMVGLSTSQSTLTAAFGERARPTIHFFGLAPGVDAEAQAAKLESAFLANGMEADSTAKLLDEAVGASLTFNRLIQGFMGLGLIVGVAALGVISARSVVERRQNIGVLRAIGFRRGMVQASFLLESSLVALSSIVVGTVLGLVLAFNIVSDSQKQPSWESLSLDVPWLNLGIIFLAVYLVALAATFAPARRASRIYPAEALRYQ